MSPSDAKQGWAAGTQLARSLILRAYGVQNGRGRTNHPLDDDGATRSLARRIIVSAAQPTLGSAGTRGVPPPPGVAAELFDTARRYGYSCFHAVLSLVTLAGSTDCSA